MSYVKVIGTISANVIVLFSSYLSIILLYNEKMPKTSVS